MRRSASSLLTAIYVDGGSWKTTAECSAQYTESGCSANPNCFWLPGYGGKVVLCADVSNETTCNITGHGEWYVPSSE